MTVPQNVILKPEVIVNQGLGTLQAELKLARIIHRVAFDQFIGRKNDSVTIRIPARIDARDYAFRNTVRDAIIVDQLEEFSLSVTFDKMPYSAVGITDEQLTLDITSFGEQVAQPQINAMARKIDGYIATAMDAATLAVEIDVDASDDPWADLFVPARRALNDFFVPGDSRYLVVGADVEDWLLTKDESFRRADESGQDGLDLLHGAAIGRKANFTVIGEMSDLDPDVAYALHPTAFAYVSGAPVVPEGAKAGSTGEFDGFAMRWIRDYDADHLTDRSIYSSFAGVTSVADDREKPDDDSDGTPYELTGKNCRAVRINFFPAS